MYCGFSRVSKVPGKQNNSGIGIPQLKMQSTYHPSNSLIFTLFALCNSIIAIILPAISSPDLSPRGRPIFNPIECNAQIPIFPPGLQTSYHNLRNICARDSLIRSGNIGCFCANEVLYCPPVSNNPPWLPVIRDHCLWNCDCGANTKSRFITMATHNSLDLSTAPWNVQEDGPNPFRDIASFLRMGEMCTSCFISGSGVLPRDEGGNCSCVKGSSITPRDGVRNGHATMLNSSREESV